MACNKNHQDVQDLMDKLPLDQGGKGRHKCAACAYKVGHEAELQHEENIDLSQLFDSLEESQAAGQRHKSPHAAYALGYYHGVAESYEE
jgi:hypothetical protein